MKKILLLIMITFSGLFASDIILSSGAKSKTFNIIANNMKSLTPMEVLTSKGSLENLENLNSGKANVALTFADAYKYYIGKNPEMLSKTTIIGTAGYGCLYSAVKAKGKVSSEDDLQKAGIKVAIGKQGAGSNATWDFMGSLDKGYTLPMIEYEGDNVALGKLKSGQLDAVLQMQNPSINNAIVKAVNNSKGELKFIDIDDYSLNDKLPDGSNVYSYKKIDIDKGMLNDTEITTICSDTLVVISKDLSDESQETLADILVNRQSTILKNTMEE